MTTSCVGNVSMVDGHTCVGTRPEDDRDLSAAALLRAMDRAGMGEALVTHVAAIRYDARDGNDQVLALCHQEPRLYPVAVVHGGMHLGVAEEVRRCAKAGCVALRLTPAQQGWSVAGAPLARVLAVAADVGLPVQVELAVSGEATTIAAANAAASARLVLANVSYSLLGEAIAVAEAHTEVALEASRLATPGVVELLVRAIGVHRLLFASGAPAWAYAPTLAVIGHADISEADREAILGGNARRLYGLLPGGAR